MSVQKRNWLVLALIVLVGAGGAAGYYAWREYHYPSPGTQRYLDYLRAFEVGVAALEAPKTSDQALARLKRAVEIIPAEPAAWADLALLHLRENQLPEATQCIQRAQELAPPDSPEIEAIRGLIDRQQGRLPEAVAHLTKAVEKEQRDLPLIFTLATLVEQENAPDADAQIARLMDRVLAIQPNNLRALAIKAVAAAHAGDQATLRDTIDHLDQLSLRWSPRSKEQLAAVHQAMQKAAKDLPIQLSFLHNVLMGERGYRRGTGKIREDAQEGTVLRHFLRLRQPPPVPAAPDRALSFRVGPWAKAKAAGDGGAARWDVLHLQWRVRAAQRASVTNAAANGGITIPPAREFEPVVWLGNGKTLRRADGDSAAAESVAFPGGASAVAPSAAGVLALDWNNDLHTNLLLAGADGLRFFRAESSGTWADVTAKMGLPADVLQGDYYGAWAADLDMDGDLDIVLARRDGPPRVLRNRGDGTFAPADVPEFAELRAVRGFVWVDLDNDGACDAVFLDAAGKLHAFANERFVRFSAWKLPENLGAIHAVNAADVNGDGLFDIVAQRQDGTLLRISDVDHRETWQTAELAQGAAPEGGIGATTIFVQDLDNNGTLDLIVAGPSTAQVFLADERYRFEPLPAPVPMQMFAVLDMNDDGRLDLLGLSSEGQPVQAISAGKLTYRWQVLRPLANPKASGDNRNNSFAIGGDVQIRAGLLVQKQRITGPMVHFGLGEQTAIDVTRVLWPSGEPQFEFEPANDALILLAQRLNGSCPFLFTYDGTGMHFAGDCLWNTPLGMYVNGQVVDSFAQTTEWLKIPGDRLVPKDGIYDVRMQANLWETDYVDQAALLVVDHAPGTEIYVDERFFLTPTPPQLYVTEPARPIARAWDHHGEDVTEIVRAIDGRYLDRAGRGSFQGITADHWVEGDLGDDAPRKGPVYLIARGWTHPTDSSINVAIGQGQIEGPRPLVLEVPDGRGGWKVGRPALGFPAGKNKTILIRLDGVDGPGVSRRFRLRTNMEIFWDFLGFARGLDPALARITRPEPRSAELRYRGILEMTQKDASSPEVPVYDRVMRGRQAWRDLEGYYTRFGDVRELLAKADDRYVIMNAGDEIALEFPVPAGPPAGWRRDFIWECDGWTRDGNANTRFGTTVLPLPMHGLKALDRPPGPLADDPVVRRFPEDWQRYHTRYVTSEDFQRGLSFWRQDPGK